MNAVNKRPGRFGQIMSPARWRNPSLPYALDNGAFGCWKNGTAFDEPAWIAHLDKASKLTERPLWAVVPDVVGDRVGTLNFWKRYYCEVTNRGFQTAFVVQNGMTVADIPRVADVIFVGGADCWKWRTLPTWTTHFRRVHVGRVRLKYLQTCFELGAESCDGTGWMRETVDGKPMRQLLAWVDGQTKFTEYLTGLERNHENDKR
jgi:hypothetical protein